MNPKHISYEEFAQQLHQSVPVIDAHNDLAGEILLRHQQGEQDVIRRLYLPNWKAAGFQLILSSIYIENWVFYPSSDIPHFIGSTRPYPSPSNSFSKTWMDYWKEETLCWEQGFEHALKQIEIIKEEIHELSEELCLVTTKNDLEEVKQCKKIGRTYFA